MRRQQPVTAIYVAQPVTTTAYGPGYTTSTASSAYVVQVPAQPVVVQQPPAPSRKRRMLPILACCGFMAALIVCATLIPFPTYYWYSMVADSENLYFVDGHFIDEVVVAGAASNDGAITTVYQFSNRPPLDATRTILRSMTVASLPSQNKDAVQRFDLYSGSTVTMTIIFQGTTCDVNLYVLRGEDRYRSVVNYNQNPSYYGTHIATLNGSATVTYDVFGGDQYYFMFYNNDYNCYPASFQVEFNVRAVSFSLNQYYISSCNMTGASHCTFYPDYATYRYYVVQAPHYGDDVLVSYSYSTNGIWWAYALLYSGLALGMIGCVIIAAVVAKRKGEKSESSQDDQAPLLHPAVSQSTQPAYVYGSSAQTSYQSGSVQTSTDVPPPYQLKYDPMTGQPVSQ